MTCRVKQSLSLGSWSGQALHTVRQVLCIRLHDFQLALCHHGTQQGHIGGAQSSVLPRQVGWSLRLKLRKIWTGCISECIEQCQTKSPRLCERSSDSGGVLRLQATYLACRFDRQGSRQRSVQELRPSNSLQCAGGCLRIRLGQLSTHHRADVLQKAAAELLRLAWPPQTVGKPLG